MSAAGGTADDPLARNDLRGAVEVAVARVKANPREPGLRWLLAELYLLQGELERADRALDAILADDPGPAVLEFRHLLRAEGARRQTFREGRVPKFQGDDPTPAQRAAMRALTLERSGDLAGAAEAAAEAESLRPRVPGTANGDRPFDDLRDGDDLFAPHVEALTVAGEYMWVPTERLASLTLDPVRRPRDLLWRRAALELRDGTEGVVYLPSVYPWSDPGTPDPIRLGRETDWTPEGEEGPVRGRGGRVWLAGEDALALSETTSLVFGPPPA